MSHRRAKRIRKFLKPFKNRDLGTIYKVNTVTGAIEIAKGCYRHMYHQLKKSSAF